MSLFLKNHSLKKRIIMKSKSNLYLLVFLALCQLTCNPECISIFNLQVQPPACPTGFEVLITDEGNNSSLRGRRVMFGKTEATSLEFVDGFGLLARVPDGLPFGETEIRIQEPDCDDEVRRPFFVMNDNEYFNAPGFIPPAPLDVVIPIVSGSVFPSSISNAWISGDSTDYCIWFKFIVDADSNETKILRSNEFDGTINGSFELGVGELACGVAPNTFYHAHPVSGIMDRDANYINIFIDRTSNNPDGQNHGIEEFLGSFVEIPDRYKGWEPLPCGSWTEERNHMIVLRSVQTGRQLVMYQQQ